MKKFLAALVLSLTAASVNITAQKSRVLQPSVKPDQAQTQVYYAEAKAFSDGRGVYLAWRTETETKNLGFNVYQIVDGKKRLASEAMIPGAYLKAREEKITSGVYSFFDRAGSLNGAYVIESLNVNGQRQDSTVINPQFVEDLRTVAGASSEQMTEQSRTADPYVIGNNSQLPNDLAAEVDSLTMPPNPVKQLWVAAQPGARIAVKNEGFYRVSRAELQAAGFDVNAPVARWQLYVNGVEQAIKVDGGGNFIEFYGKGAETLYTETQIYFLVVGPENGKRIASASRRRLSTSVVSNGYAQSFFRKDRVLYLASLLNGDTENFFGGQPFGTNGLTVNANLSSVDFTASTASVTVKTLGVALATHQNRVFLNDAEIGNFSSENFDAGTGTFTFSTSLLVEGANRIKIASTSGNSVLDSVQVNFVRRYVANQNRLSFYVPNYKTSYLSGFTTQNIRVFDTTNTDTPILLTGMPVELVNGSYRVTIPSNRGRVMYAVEDTAVLTAASVTANTASTLSNANHNADFVIVSHKNFLAQANEWADYRRGQGMLVEVVDIEDVYDEFAFGALDADCIRNFLNYAKNNWQTRPRYVLLLGDASFDPKNYLGIGGNFLPTRLVDTVYSEIGSDDTLADFDDDGLAELAIGRIPARTAADVTLALNKVKAFELTAGQAPTRGALFASDLPDGYDFEALSNRLCDELPTSYNCVKINRASPTAGSDLFAALNQGKFLVNYSGHGNAAVWASGGFFGNSQAGQLSNSNLSVFTMLTCLNGYFVDPRSDSVSEVLMKNPNGGAVVAWASSGLTTPDIQEVMAARFYNRVGIGGMSKMGDFVNDAKTTINFGRDVRLSWVLLGDPTMKVR